MGFDTSALTDGLSNKISAGLATTQSILIIVFYIAAFLTLCYFMWKVFSHNIQVKIRKRTGENGFIVEKERGKFVAEKHKPGVRNFVMLRDKRWKKPLDRTYLEMEKAAFGRIKYVVNFCEDEQGNLQPIKPVQKGDLYRWDGWRPVDMEFTVTAAKEAINLFTEKNWWEKYQMLVILGGFLIIAVVFMIMFDKLGSLTSALAGFNNNIGGFTAALQNMTNTLSGHPTQFTQVIQG